jgi:hypothetical protein
MPRSNRREEDGTLCKANAARPVRFKILLLHRSARRLRPLATLENAL